MNPFKVRFDCFIGIKYILGMETEETSKKLTSKVMVVLTERPCFNYFIVTKKL